MANLGSSSRALRAALFLAAASTVLACGDDDEPRDSDAGDVTDDDAGRPDGGARIDGSTQNSDEDGNSPGEGDAGEGEAACEATDTCPVLDPLAPFALNCASLPTTGTCAGGPREVLLVIDDSGQVAMFDPTDGHYLGVFKYASDSYYNYQADEFELATQGPDQCIWTVSPDEGVEVERWDTDGAFFDKPLQQQYVPVSGSQDDPVISSPVSLAFTRDSVYLANEGGNPAARLAKFSLPTAKDEPGRFDSVVLAEEDGSFTGVAALGDGSLVLADNDRGNVIRLASDGTRTTVLQSELEFPLDVVYAGEGKILVVDEQSGAPAYRVDLATGVADTIPPFNMSSSNHSGLYPLKNGNWLISGGGFYVSVLEPNSSNPRGQNQLVWDDQAKTDNPNFNRVGRACLPDAFVASRAPTTPPAPPVAPAVCVPQVPTGDVLFAEDFNDGPFTGTAGARRYKDFREVPTADVSVDIAPGAGPDGSGALVIDGAHFRTRVNGVSIDIAAVRPTYIAYDVQGSVAAELGLGGITFENSAVVEEVPYQSLLGTSLYNLYLGADNSNTASELPFDANSWIHVEMRNINWTTHTFDLFANCTRIGEGLYIPPPYGNTVNRIHMWNTHGSSTETPDVTAWFDNILVK